MCEGFDCLDCPAYYAENCYYYGKDFMDYYKKIQQENKAISSSYWSINFENVDFKTDTVL